MWVSKDDRTSVTPACCSRAAFSSVRRKRFEGRDVGERLDHNRDVLPCELAGDHPSFRGAEQDDFELELFGETYRREHVTRAMRLDRERDLATDHGTEGLEIQPSARVVAAPRRVPGGAIEMEVDGVLQRLAQAQDCRRA